MQSTIKRSKPGAIKCNGYEINYNDFWKYWQISHEEIGLCIAEFKSLKDALDYCKAG